MSLPEVVSRSGSLSTKVIGLGGVAAVLGGTTVLKPWGRVPEGYVALREKFDHVKKDKYGNPKPVLVTDGLRYKAPFKGSLKLMDVRIQATDLDDTEILKLPDLKPDEVHQPIDISRGILWAIRSTVFWRVPPFEDSVYRALYKAKGGEEERNQILRSICTNGLRNALQTVRDQDMNSESLLSAKIYNQCSDELHEYGVEFEGLKIRSVAPVREEILRSAILQSGISVTPSALAAAGEIVSMVPSSAA